MTKPDAVLHWLRKHAEPTAPALFSMSREDAQRLVAWLNRPPEMHLTTVEPNGVRQGPFTFVPGDTVVLRDCAEEPFLTIEVS